MPRLIVRVLSMYTPAKCSHAGYWKRGIVLLHEESHILITCTAHQIQLFVRGDVWWSVEQVYCNLMEAVTILLNEWESIEITQSVRCFKCVQKGIATPNEFQLKELESNTLKGVTGIYCPGCEDYISLEKLVPDIQLVFFKGRTIPIEAITLGKELGKGAFASVLLGQFEGKDVAVKRLETDAKDADLSGYSAEFEEFRKEILVMSRLNSPFCVALLAICLSPLSLICELVPNGDLYGFLHNSPEKELSWPLRLKIIGDICEGMLAMHSCVPTISHLDLKSPNVLMMSFNPNDPVCAKVTDFGLSSTGDVQYNDTSITQSG
eukprot:TRINITY_DN3002_c0_g2_i1.p1 TRINITY_DN3002_c0_g2~~TRINITY_DN3002_c0_g2_i1.p1  ORF type:complete len:321 (-),score=33.97 TRINITY_DN3002_c0_g2_i1:38-1000(-)